MIIIRALSTTTFRAGQHYCHNRLDRTKLERPVSNFETLASLKQRPRGSLVTSASRKRCARDKSQPHHLFASPPRPRIDHEPRTCNRRLVEPVLYLSEYQRDRHPTSVGRRRHMNATCFEHRGSSEPSFLTHRLAILISDSFGRVLAGRTVDSSADWRLSKT